MLTILFVILLILALGGGGWGHSRFGAVGWAPSGLILLILVFLFFSGRLGS